MKQLSLILLAVTSLVYGASLMELSPRIFFFLPPAVIVFFPILLFIFFSLGVAGSWFFFKAVFFGVNPEKFQETFDRLIKIGFSCGGICVVFGMIQAMGNLTSTDKLGAGIANVFIGIIYGAVPMLLSSLTLTNSDGRRSSLVGFWMVAVSTISFSCLCLVLYALRG